MILTKHELEVMRVFWEHGEGLTHVEILERSPLRSWKDSTIHMLLNGLLRKGAIGEIGKKPSGRRFSRIFAPLITPEEYEKLQLQDVISNANDLTLLSVFSAFIEEKPISEQEREELIAILASMGE